MLPNLSIVFRKTIYVSYLGNYRMPIASQQMDNPAHPHLLVTPLRTAHKLPPPLPPHYLMASPPHTHPRHLSRTRALAVGRAAWCRRAHLPIIVQRITISRQAWGSPLTCQLPGSLEQSRANCLALLAAGWGTAEQGRRSRQPALSSSLGPMSVAPASGVTGSVGLLASSSSGSVEAAGCLRERAS